MAGRTDHRRKKRTDPRLIIWAWGALEADFWQYYRTDLNELAFSNSMSMRRFSVLVGGLPTESAFARWLRNKKNRDMAEISIIDDEIFRRG